MDGLSQTGHQFLVVCGERAPRHSRLDRAGRLRVRLYRRRATAIIPRRVTHRLWRQLREQGRAGSQCAAHISTGRGSRQLRPRAEGQFTQLAIVRMSSADSSGSGPTATGGRAPPGQRLM